jgi:hypothetical protein
MKQKETITGFDFQVIPINEARRMALAGSGNYSDLKEMLLEKLETLNADQAFVFGLRGGKDVPMDHRRPICMVLNGCLRKAKIDWRITYNGPKKLFIAVPPKVPQKTVRLKTLFKQTGKNPRELEMLIKTAANRFKVTEEDILRNSQKVGNIRYIRKAVMVIANSELGYSFGDIALTFKLSPSGVDYIIKRAGTGAEEYIKKLALAK